MKISFIVLTYNRSDALILVLKSLAKQCTNAHEIIIADDGSAPDHVDDVRRRCPVFDCAVAHVWQPDMGFTAAKSRNLAASQSHGDYLVFIDGDCIPNRHFVKQHERLAERGCFVNGSRVLISQKLTNEIIKKDIDVTNQSLIFWIGARVRGDCNKLLQVFTWPSRWFRVQQGFVWRGIRSCNFGVWKSDFSAVNGFDETFEGWGHEDADLVLRLANFGIKRKNGFLATDVFHLWHLQSPRTNDMSNKQRVVARMNSKLVVAERGLNQIVVTDSVKTTFLQPTVRLPIN